MLSAKYVYMVLRPPIISSSLEDVHNSCLMTNFGKKEWLNLLVTNRGFKVQLVARSLEDLEPVQEITPLIHPVNSMRLHSIVDLLVEDFSLQANLLSARG